MVFTSKLFFYLSMKILEKMSKDARVYKKYDDAKTPYKRCLESNKLSNEEKQRLIRIKEGVNIIELKTSVETALMMF